MGPYLAVIYDCFFEAFKSRILWVLLVGWTVLLAILAPFGWIEGDDFVIRSESITNRDRLLKELQALSRGNGTEAQKRVWTSLDADFKMRVVKSAGADGPTVNIGRLADGMSSALDDRNLYQKDAWPTAAARDDLKSELEDYKPGALSEQELTRVNRRLIELAFPTGLKNTSQSAVWVGYAGIKIADPIPVSREQLRPFFDVLILRNSLKLALGVVGVLIAIVVTSNLIPDMFVPGSMALLLSKPISRSGLLLSKYVGGVFFILLNATYVLVGFYFLLGWRLQIWNVGLFWCIPIFVFAFMIFYSVSALIGLIWKNPIVSVVFVALFWGICSILGMAHFYMRVFTVEVPQINELTTFNEHLMGTNQNGRLLYWSGPDREWKAIGGNSAGGIRVLGPYWLAREQMIVFGRLDWNPMFGLQSDGIRLQSINLNPREDATEGQNEDINLPLWSEKRIESLAQLPPATRRVKVVGESLIAVSEDGIYQFDAEAALKNSQTSKQADKAPLLSYLKWPSLNTIEVNRKLTDAEVSFETPIDFCELKGSGILVLSKGVLHRFDWMDDGRKLASIQTMDLQLPEDSLALIAANENNCLVFTNKSHAVRIDLAKWTKHEDLNETLSGFTPQQLYPMSDGKFVMLNREGNVVVVDQSGKSFYYPPQHDRVRAIAIGENGDIYFCNTGNEVQKLPSGQDELALVSKPRWTTAQWVYWTFIRPVYTVFPKPSSVDSLLIWALTDEKQTFSFAQQTEDIQQQRDIDIWTPIWSNALFITVVLILGCIYLSRQDT